MFITHSYTHIQCWSRTSWRCQGNRCAELSGLISFFLLWKAALSLLHRYSHTHAVMWSHVCRHLILHVLERQGSLTLAQMNRVSICTSTLRVYPMLFFILPFPEGQSAKSVSLWRGCVHQSSVICSCMHNRVRECDMRLILHMYGNGAKCADPTNPKP